ncbi:16659_t:CDS:2 [Dentiscutata heterogama]|uniref:16659_t:CDS:1 n=1 Tax=Dentiscutata heterogama TaxID=1316150 RepID=A0ACA9KGB8_9GLOM|nr:16659_t:CDS:2 [Dentiscutata heterogama]
MELAPSGNLRSYLEKNSKTMTWKKKVEALLDIIIGLDFLHERGVVHRDFHLGNLLVGYEGVIFITDIGQCVSADESSSTDIGVLHYYEKDLILERMNGLQPRIPHYVPEQLTKLIKECWNIDSKKRPTSEKLHRTIKSWNTCNDFDSEFIEAEKKSQSLDLLEIDF